MIVNAHGARAGIFNYLTGRAICQTPRPVDEAEALLDAYRTEVLAKAIGRLRAIPVDCTALTGPVWYGDGWNSAITCLEEIAEYQTPDDEAYPGELQRLRALALGLRVAALRKEDLAEAQRLLVIHAEHEMNAREKATAPTATVAPDFFQRGHTYHRDEDGTRTDPFVWVFEVRSVETHPDGTRYAFGFLTSKGSDTAPVPHPEWEGSWPDGWASAGWTDVTEAGGSRG